MVWLGRRRIAGIEPGRSIEVEGRIGAHDGDRVMYNPRYELSTVTDRHADRDRDGSPVAAVETVEAVVRAQLAKALGGRRGMVEAAVPTLALHRSSG